MPSGGALFGNASSGPGSTGGNKHLVEFRAGKMNMRGRMVHPDNRKGLLYIYQSDDSLMHFCWQDRTSGIIEDDLIIFPDDCEYVHVSKCTSGRVYLLKFKSSNRKFFFWLQEPRTEKDEDNCKRINELLNNPSSAVQSSTSPDQDLQSLLNNMSQSQLMQLFGGGVGQMGGLSSLLGTIRGPPGSTGSARTTSAASPAAITHRSAVASTPSTTAPVTTAANVTPQGTAPASSTPGAPTKARREAGFPASHHIQLSDLQQFLSGITRPSASAQSVDLSTAMNQEGLSDLLRNPEAVEALQTHVPAVDGKPRQTLRTTINSPQFQQAVSQFSSAFESGQLGPVVSQMAVNPEAVAAANSGNMEDFVKALEKTGTTGSSSGKEDNSDGNKVKKEPKKEDKDEDEQMQLD